MAVRQDWTRLTRTIHYFLLPLHFETRKDILPHKTAANPELQFIAGNVAIRQNRRLLAEVERRKGRAVTNNVRNQLR